MAKQANWIAPSILSADFAQLGQEIEHVLASGADVIHFDVMDNHYVPNLTFGPCICESLKKYMQRNQLNAPLDVHLMVEPVDQLIESFAHAGADYISFHPEASKHVDRSLQWIRSLGCKAGLALNPATPLSHLNHVLDKLDIIVIMSVNPGFGGQSLIPESFNKIRECRALIDQSGHDIRLEIDGGAKVDNIAQIADAGCDTFVMGSGIFSNASEADAQRYNTIIEQTRQQLAAFD